VAGEKTELASDFRDLLRAFVDHEVHFEGARVPVLGRADFLADETALGRTRDLADAERLKPAGAIRGE
jgi:hypothetical protein